MTLALNRRLPLSGNNLRLVIILMLVWCASCSPKVRQAAVPEPYIPMPKPVEKPVVRQEVSTSPVSLSVANIAMIMPFNLDEVSTGYRSADLKKANMAVEYYQGFKLALDSLTANGYNYRLQLFDGKDNPGIAHSLGLNPKVRNSDLVVGPVYPESIKAFSIAFAGVRKPILSPLSPASPAVIKNNYLITATPPLSFHARRSAQYVNDRLKAKKVFILRSGFTEENKYVLPFKQALDSLSKLRTKVISTTVVRGNLDALIPLLSKTEANIILLPSVNQAFLQVTLRSVDSIAKLYPVILIGHPSWEGLAYLKADMLQRLKTVITSSDHISYKAGSTVAFIKAYRKAYHAEPGSYGIKGFDEGLYFGQLLARTETGMIRPEKYNFEGLDNNFHFEKKPGVGWINTHVYILRYSNFELKVIE